MSDWWNALSSIQQILYCFAIPSTTILFIQFGLSLLGIGDDLDGEVNIDFEVDDSDLMSTDFRFVSFRGVIAFFTVSSWTALSLLNAMPNGMAIMLGIIAGLIAMFIIGYLFYATSKLQSSGNISFKNAIGIVGEVYIPIPKSNTGSGKIQILIQERLIEATAVTYNDEKLETGSLVKVIELIGESTLVVEPEK